MTHPLTPRENLTRPIVGIENRTAQEVFDIMSDRFRAHLAALASGSGDHAELAELREHRIAADLLVSSLKSDKAEAERKLAEAVGLLEEILPPVLCGESWGLPDDDVSHQRMSFGWIKKVRTFLSKEAERG